MRAPSALMQSLVSQAKMHLIPKCLLTLIIMPDGLSGRSSPTLLLTWFNIGQPALVAAHRSSAGCGGRGRATRPLRPSVRHGHFGHLEDRVARVSDDLRANL